MSRPASQADQASDEFDAQIKALKANFKYLRSEEEQLPVIWGRFDYCAKLEQTDRDLAELRDRRR